MSPGTSLIRIHQVKPYPPRIRPRACRHCHKNKEKCDLVHSQSSCSNCYRLGIPCHTRQLHRMGRKPKIKEFSYGFSSVVELRDSMPQHNTERILACTVEKPINERYLGSNPHGTASRDLTKYLFRVSDAFFARPLESSLPLQEQIAKILTTRESFLTANRPFMLGSSFIDQFQATVVLLFRHSPCVLSEAYGVLLELMRNPSAQQQHQGDLHIAIATRSLQRLQQLSCSILTIRDAAVFILLGQILLAYNAFLPLASYTPIITRCILGSTGHWYDALRSQPEFDNISIAPVLIDTVDCLIRREKPMIRLPEVARCSVERLSGYCSSLLPHLYDVARLSHEIKTASLKTSDKGINMYKDIEKKIAAWTPPACATCLAKFSIDEISVMSSQAYAYRDAALLVIHRLRFPFGTKDCLAQDIAKRMLERLTLSLKISSTDYRPLLLDFPLLVASLELPALGKSTFQIFEPFRYRDARITLEFVEYVEQKRLEGHRGSWFELVEGNLLNDFIP